MKKLDMESRNNINKNIEKIAELFPNVIVEGKEGVTIDFEKLKQELSNEIIDNTKECYQVTWPGKKQAVLNVNIPTNKTLRPVKEKSVDFENTQNIYIEGDNLDALKILQESYLNKIKLIYIDPPYSTDYIKQSIEQIIKLNCIDENTLIIASNAKVASIVEDEFDERNLVKSLKKSFPNNNVIKFNNNSNFVSDIISIVDKYNNIIVYSYDAYKDYIQTETINELLKNNKEIFVVSIKGPIDQKYFNNLINYSCLYEYTPNSIRTIIKQLNNEISLNGKLPK